MASEASAASKSHTLRVLLLEDNPLDAELSLCALRQGGFDVESDTSQSEADFRLRISGNLYDVILADYNLPQWRGIESVEILRSEHLDIPVILVTGSLGDVAAVECIKQGITDYVLKDKLARLPSCVRRALEEKRLREERARAEIALKENQNRLASILGSAMDAIITVDEQQRIVLFNAAAESVFRCPAAEALGQSIGRFVPERYRATHEGHVHRYATTGKTRRAMGRLETLMGLRADGAEFPMEASLSRVETQEGNLFTIILRDITEQEALRQKRQQAEDIAARRAEDLARSNRDLEQFAYVASHDLQEPLRMVASYTQLLAERYRGKLDENADKYISYAVEGSMRMQALIQDLLAFSRIGRNGNGPKSTDCNSALEEARLNLGSAIDESHASIVAEDLPWVAVQRSQVVQLLQNLIGNAIKFRGPLPPAIRVSVQRRGDEWMLSVADNGIGIAPEYRDVIFAIFQRLHTRSEYPGNGVGLAICKKIVEQHGGRIWVESEPQRGSTFLFTLPACDAREDYQSPQPEHGVAAPVGA